MREAVWAGTALFSISKIPISHYVFFFFSSAVFERCFLTLYGDLKFSLGLWAAHVDLEGQYAHFPMFYHFLTPQSSSFPPKALCPQLPWDEPKVKETRSSPAYGWGRRWETAHLLEEAEYFLGCRKVAPRYFGEEAFLASRPLFLLKFLLAPLPAQVISTRSLHLVHIQHGVSVCVILFVFISVIPLLFAQLLSDCCLKVSQDNCRTPA